MNKSIGVLSPSSSITIWPNKKLVAYISTEEREKTKNEVRMHKKQICSTRQKNRKGKQEERAFNVEEFEVVEVEETDKTNNDYVFDKETLFTEEEKKQLAREMTAGI